MSDMTQLEMTIDEARETDRLIKRHINTTRYLLLDMRDRKGWKALGYESFVEYGEKELNLGAARIYQLADAAEISLQIGFSTKVENQPKETHLRPLKSVPEDERKAIWEEAARKAEEEHARLTAKRVEEAVSEWKRRSDEFKEESNERRKRIRALEEENDSLKARPAPETIRAVEVVPADYEAIKAKAAQLESELAATKKEQTRIIQSAIKAKMSGYQGELDAIEARKRATEDHLAGLQQQIDRYTMRQRELKVHLDVIEGARTAMALLAANLEGFESVIDPDHELRQWNALADMLRNGAAAIEFFVGGQRPALTVIRGGADR